MSPFQKIKSEESIHCPKQGSERGVPEGQQSVEGTKYPLNPTQWLQWKTQKVCFKPRKTLSDSQGVGHLGSRRFWRRRKIQPAVHQGEGGAGDGLP